MLPARVEGSRGEAVVACSGDEPSSVGPTATTAEPSAGAGFTGVPVQSRPLLQQHGDHGATGLEHQQGNRAGARAQGTEVSRTLWNAALQRDG